MATTGSNATGFRIVAGVAAIDFDKDKFECTQQESGLFDLDSVNPETIHLTLSLHDASTHPWIVILGIEFCHLTGNKVVIADRKYNAMAVVKVI
jgi:hypothetical protein